MQTLLTPFLLGVAAPTVVYRTLGWEGGNLVLGLVVIALVFSTASIVSCWLLPRRAQAVIVLLYVGITLGMLIDSLSS